MNPYQYGRFLSAMLDEPERFIGPREELEELLVRVSDEQPAAVQLVGPWGVGKSFLLQLLASNHVGLRHFLHLLGPRFRQAPERLHFVLISFTKQTLVGPERPFAVALWERLLAALTAPAPQGEVNPFTKVVAAYLAALPATQRTAPGGKQLLDLLTQLDGAGLRAVLLLDDFDAVGPELKLDDYNLLWSLVQRTSLVITSSQPLSLLAPVPSKVSPFFSLLQQLNRTRGVLSMFFLTQADALRLVLEPPTWDAATAGFRFSRADAMFIIDLVGLYHDFIRLSCEEIYQWHQRFGTAEGPDRIPAAARPIVRVRLRQVLDLSFRLLWGKLKRPEQAALVEVARGDDPPRDLAVFERLMELSYVVFREGRVRPFATLFEEYVLEQGAERDPTGPGVAWPAAIKLTNLERRLVGELLVAPERTLMPEVLARRLYPDDAPMEGLKGRLEVLISRLRGKLRRDDLPGYGVESVRGKGYRLTLPERGRGR